jgi:hypothetical protein
VAASATASGYAISRPSPAVRIATITSNTITAIPLKNFPRMQYAPGRKKTPTKAVKIRYKITTGFLIDISTHSKI